MELCPATVMLRAVKPSNVLSLVVSVDASPMSLVELVMRAHRITMASPIVNVSVVGTLIAIFQENILQSNG